MASENDRLSRSASRANRLHARLTAVRAQQIRVEPDPARRYRPFALADMQHAYWMGRQATFSHAGAIQFYAQYRCRSLELTRLEDAWNQLIARHDMLRATVTTDGLQQVAPSVPRQSITRGSLAGLSPSQQQEVLDATWRGMQDECVPLENWPQSRLHFDALEEGDGHLHVKLDLWNVDGRSLHILFDELAQLYQWPDRALPELQMQFCDYVAALKEQEASTRYQRALAWWQKRLQTLPPAPVLPRRAESAGHRFLRWSETLPPERLSRLNDSARRRGLSLAAVILTVYASTLARWSASRHFTLNVPRFNRPDWHPDIGNVIGEFASFSLLEVDLRESASFGEHAMRLQTRLWDDLDHQEVSGVRQLRELARLQQLGTAAAMPIVFTTTPGLRAGAALTPRQIGAVFGEPLHIVSRTPQVLIDCQYLVDGGSLLYNWDAMPGAFPEGMLDDMFGVFSRALQYLAERDEAWDAPLALALPPTQAATRAALWREMPCEPRTPAQALAAHARGSPQAAALIPARGEPLSYQALAAQVSTLASTLQQAQVDQGDRVILLLQRGWQQTVGLLACQWLGAVAVPLDVHQPESRLMAIARNAKPKLVLVNAWASARRLAELPVLALPEHPPSVAAAPLAPVSFEADAVCCVIFTSGSTGLPKGVEIPQGALANVLQYSLRTFHLRASDRVLSVTAQHHDLALFDQLATFCAGAALVVPGASPDTDPSHWLDLMQAHSVTVWNSVPRFMEMLLASAQAAEMRLPASLRQVLLGGDWIAPDVAAQLLQYPGLRLRSIGGPTETVVCNITHEVSAADTALPSIPYGKPIDNCRYYVLDDQLDDCPDHVPGEMFCGGAGLAVGYLGDAQQTAERFLVHPRTGERIYRTGDRGAYRPDGSLLILGRTDFQINAGGYRCDPLEIESAVLAHAGVRRAVALDVARGDSGSMLAVCYEPGDQACDEADLRHLCAQRLPAVAIPRIFLPLGQFPLTANGKVDRRALAELAVQYPEPTRDGRPPENRIEEQLLDIWRAVLGVELANVETGFFASGGDSLSATRLLLQIEKTFGIRPPLAMVFSHPTVQAMALWLGARPSVAEVAAWPVADLQQPRQSWAQQRLWFMAQLAPGNPFFNLCYRLELDGPADADAFARALRRLVERHEPLRCRFPASAPVGTCVVDPGVEDLLSHEDLRCQDATAQEARLAAWAEQERGKGFDLEHGPLLRAHLFSLSDSRHVLFYSLHHIAFDGWSADLFNQELFSLYLEESGVATATLPDIARYTDFAQSQHDTPVAHVSETLAFWQERLGELAALNLPGDHPRPPVQSFRGAVSRHRLDSMLTRKLGALSASHGVTPFVTLLTAMQVALGRMAGQEQFVMGSVVSGRDHPATESMIGFFINNLLLRGNLAENVPFTQQLGRVRDEFLGAQARQHYPLQQLVQSMSAGADLSRNPLYQVSFTYQPAGLAHGRFGQLSVTGRSIVPETTHMDLEIIAIPDGDELIVAWLYASDLYDAASIERWHLAFTHVLSAAVDAPDTGVHDLPLASDAHSRAWAWVDGGPALAGTDPWPVLQAYAARLPEREVLRYDGGSAYTWAQLITRVEQLAGWIAGHAAPASPVAVRLHPGFDYVAAILAVLRLGRAWAPLDPRRPAPVVADMLTRVGAGCLISERALWDTAQVSVPLLLTDQDAPAEPASLAAYSAAPEEAIALIQHTSGSEGQPKGVEITYGNLRRRLTWGQLTASMGVDDIACLKTSPAFVDAVGELLDSLLAGMTLIVASPDQARSPSELVQLIRRHGVTRLMLTPSLADAVFALPEAMGLPLRALILGGENVRTSLAQRCLDALPEGATVLNYYGATELTSDGAWHPITRADLSLGTSHVSIGQPLPGTTLWLLDRQGRLAAPGCPGQIHVSGQNLAHGYRHAPELSADTFRNWRTPDGRSVRLYATGDIAVRDGQGRLRCLGRRDHQLKLRGMRVEAGEIETLLRRHPAVRDAIIALWEGDAQQRLVAHVLLEPQGEVDAVALRRHLADALPQALIPSHWSLQREWPVTATGKVDRRRLRFEDLTVAGRENPFVPAATPLQQTIAQAWKDLLGIERVGIHDNFFDMGGNSLLLTQLHRQLSHALQRELPLTFLFQYPNIHALAERLGDVGEASARGSLSTNRRAAARLAARGFRS